MKTHSNETKLNKLINDFLGEVCNLPNLTESQWIKLSNALIHLYEKPDISAAVHLLRSFYQEEEAWTCAKGNTFAKYVETFTNTNSYLGQPKPMSQSKLSLKYALDIVKFILDNRKFLTY